VEKWQAAGEQADDGGMDGRAYLEKLIADALGAGKGQPIAGRQSSLNLWEIRGVAKGLVAAGILSQQDADQILADMEETLKQAGWLKVVRLSASTTSSTAEIKAKRVGVQRAAWRRAIEDPPTPMLRDVDPLVDRTLPVGDVTAHLLSLEVWSTFLALNLAYLNGGRMRDHFSPDVRWRGWDDAGTQYRGGGGGASGSHGLLVERRMFQPGPPPEARVLTLSIEQPDNETSFSIPLIAE
jgi:hypothetical protein